MNETHEHRFRLFIMDSLSDMRGQRRLEKKRRGWMWEINVIFCAWKNHKKTAHSDNWSWMGKCDSYTLIRDPILFIHYGYQMSPDLKCSPVSTLHFTHLSCFASIQKRLRVPEDFRYWSSSLQEVIMCNLCRRGDWQ